MTEPVQYIFRRKMHANQSEVARAVIRLECAVPELTDAVSIKAVRFWLQGPLTSLPSDVYGDVSCGIDIAGRYVAANGWPEVELPNQPMINYTKTLGAFQVYPGLPERMKWERYGDAAFTYRRKTATYPGDRIIFAPQFGGSVELDLEFGLIWDHPADIVVHQDGTTAYAATVDSPTAGNPAHAKRMVFPNITPGTNRQIRVHYTAAGTQCIISRTAIGFRVGSTSSMSGVIPLTAMGAQNIWMRPGWEGDRWSDWLDWPEFDAAADLMVSCDQSQDGTVNNWAYKDIGGAVSYSSSAPSAYSEAMAGTASEQSGRTHFIDQIEVR